MAEENQNLEETMPQSCTKRQCACSRLFCLKGLATIYKVLSILTLVLMVIALISGWIDSGRLGYPTRARVMLLINYLVTYALTALFFITVSRVLKTLRKIKHAVEHR